MAITILNKGNVDKIRLTWKQEGNRVWETTTNTNYSISVNSEHDVPIPSYLPDPEINDFHIGYVGRVVSIDFGTSYYIVTGSYNNIEVTPSIVMRQDDLIMLRYQWVQVIEQSYNRTNMPTAHPDYVNQVARITNYGAKRWVATGSVGGYTVYVHVGTNIPSSSYLPSASNYDVGTRGLVESVDYNPAYYVVEQPITYTYYKCMVV